MPYDDRDGPTWSDRLTYFLIGGALGAVIALLLAPKPGAELRGDIADATRRGIDRSREASQELSDRAGEYYEATRARAAELYGERTRRAETAALHGDDDFPEPAGSAESGSAE